MGDAKRLPEIEPLRDLYADIHPTALTLRDRPIESVMDAFRRCDPIAVRLDLHGRNVGERWLLRRSLAYIDKDGDSTKQYDNYFACIFWQTVRVRCQYYRAVVERPLTGGLQWFIRFYNRIGALRAPLESILPQMSYDVAAQKHRIKALELRIHPTSTPIGMGEKILSIAQSWKRVLNDVGSTFEPEIGVVFHFVKSRDAKEMSASGAPAAFFAGSHAEPFKDAMDVERGRYVGYFSEQCRNARALAELIQAVPSSLWLIRGLDVANDELAVPTWVLAPIFRYVLDEAAKASLREEEGAGPPLRLTAHVGEDFRHLMEGMRRIYEQVHYIHGNTRGRLGHAVALGVDPQGWAESVGSILMPAEERLLDLIFEWRLYSKYRIRPEFAATAPAGRVSAIENKVRELSDLIYGKCRYSVDALAEAHHTLHRFLVPPFAENTVIDGALDTFRNGVERIRNWSSPERQIHSRDEVTEIFEKYFEDESTFRRGQTLVDVTVSPDEVAALTAVQYGLRRGIAHSGIVIEVNPSSNLLIGDLLDFRHHPILRLFPPVSEPGDPPPVLIALGSDDPLTFSTSLLQEYTLLHQAACAAGYPERVVQDWLESIRRNGMDARFTRAWRPSAMKMTDSLIKDLSNYLHLPHC
jgi:hypothetical protein